MKLYNIYRFLGHAHDVHVSRLQTEHRVLSFVRQLNYATTNGVVFVDIKEQDAADLPSIGTRAGLHERRAVSPVHTRPRSIDYTANIDTSIRLHARCLVFIRADLRSVEHRSVGKGDRSLRHLGN